MVLFLIFLVLQWYTNQLLGIVKKYHHLMMKNYYYALLNSLGVLVINIKL